MRYLLVFCFLFAFGHSSRASHHDPYALESARSISGVFGTVTVGAHDALKVCSVEQAYRMKISLNEIIWLAVLQPAGLFVQPLAAALHFEPKVSKLWLERGEADLRDVMIRKIPRSLRRSFQQGPFGRRSIIIFHLLQQVAYLQAHGINHNDIKPENVLLILSPEGQLSYKLADFGFAAAIAPPQATSQVTADCESGTVEFVAPERIRGSPYFGRSTHNADVWSLGIIFYELLSDNRFPYEVRDPKQLHFQQVRALLHLWPEKIEALARHGFIQQQQLLDLLTQMLELDPDKRISAAAALEHPYFACLKLDRQLPPPLAAANLAFAKNYETCNPLLKSTNPFGFSHYLVQAANQLLLQ